MSKGKASKPHIGIFGRRNNGKSSLINVLAGQDIAIVSEIAGTTTDPVKKSMEIPGVGPVVLVDTAGIDDTGELGEKRVAKTKQVLNTIDLALLVITANEFDQTEKDLVAGFEDFAVPYIVIHNKNDLVLCDRNILLAKGLNSQVPLIPFSALKFPEPDEIIRTINLLMPESAYQSNSLVGDLIKYGDVVLLITPIDVEAPEGRLILPPFQVIRDVLDDDGKRAVGTRLIGPAYSAVFKEGRPYRGEAPILGHAYLTAYDPIRDNNGSIIGVGFFGVGGRGEDGLAVGFGLRASEGDLSLEVLRERGAREEGAAEHCENE